MSAPVRSRYDLERPDLAALLQGEPAYRVGQVWDGLHARLAEPAEMTDVPARLRRGLADALPAALTPVTTSTSADGGTVKWLWALADGHRVETVLMHYDRRSTVCVSSQAGCAMGCGFCATGQGGFDRNLTTGEILEQVVRAARHARDAPDGARRVGNVVFMGMASHWPTTTAPGRRCDGCTTTSASRPVA